MKTLSNLEFEPSQSIAFTAAGPSRAASRSSAAMSESQLQADVGRIPAGSALSDCAGSADFGAAGSSRLRVGSKPDVFHLSGTCTLTTAGDGGS